MNKIIVFFYALLMAGICLGQTYTPIYSKKGEGLETQGSPYVISSYSTLKINGQDHPAKARYNAMEDRVEFEDMNYYPINVGDELNFVKHKKKYVYTDYKDRKNNPKTGFLAEVQGGKKVKFYKRESITFVKGKIAETSYEKDIADKYELNDKEFYLKIGEGEFIYLPNSRKSFSKLFGDKEKEVSDFLKKNDYSLSNPNDLKIIVNYLNTIL